ncbi:DUF262 domain-containing protein [Cupriavidus necator]|uniref:DUF262 domain-containing protein n=1 Tax=Cupriavidus necator TaxID=106590 RepID=A0A367PR15_CUPNE|nr:DUF262 domain-containing protein [Cupriavidus necator]QQX85256.1 DUF262 domain-containing protein [Cupriavidus necator]RCJ10278.1 DUF262 domain-containing protein [Cupriavidus necator]
MEIQPDKQNLDQTFSTTVYFIDFYQRDYKWNEEPVRRLLDDVFYQFDETYQKHSGLEPNKENINAKYPWYYLNTYVTNTIGGRVFVVDGQQRLTTLTLVLLKLYSMASVLGSKTAGWIERKIAGYSGTEHEFWMNHVKHRHVLKALMEGTEPSSIDVSTGVTAANMVGNYQLISAELNGRLNNKHKFDTFVHYLLCRLVLINLSVDSTHVPMVFEVINDRGVRLKPYEILKGKLLGQIDKLELETGKFNELWEAQLYAVNSFKEDEIDNLFRYWLKAKYANTRKAGQRFDGEYHREIFKGDLNKDLKLDHNSAEVKIFLKGSFRYYTGLYARLWKATQTEDPSYPSLYFNSLNELDSQFMLVLSACTVDDPEEADKIRIVSAALDRVFSLLQLQGAYDSNEFATRLFEISSEIREKPASEIAAIFEKHFLAELTERRGIPIAEAFSYALFRPMTIDRLNTRFTRYVFGRVERLLADGMKLKMKHALKDLVTLRGARNGFHVEHILSRNQENLDLFNGDEERFEQERNRLGGILLLKGLDNISSNNEVYAKKLESYANTLYWNETLRADSYKSKLHFSDFAEEHKLPFAPLSKFGPDDLESRQRLLFDLVAIIWS